MFLKTSSIIKLFSIVLTLFFAESSVAQTSPLSVEKIMQNPQWMGTFPSNVEWGPQGETIYFEYNPEQNPVDSLYKIRINNQDKIEKVSLREKRNKISSYGTFNEGKTKKLVTEDGVLYIYDVKKDTKKELLQLDSSVQDPTFMNDEDKITFTYANNAYRYDLEKGNLHKLTNIHEGKVPKEDDKETRSKKDKWLEDENLELLQVVHGREEDEEKTEAYNNLLRICLEITCPFLWVLLPSNCVENTRHSYGYVCVFRLVDEQNNCL